MSSDTTIRFEDGTTYERYMGAWSRLAGDTFLDWLAPQPGLRWLDVGCGNGAFTEMLMERAAPSATHGVDPSEQQLAYARSRPHLREAEFHLGDAMSLPFPNGAFDAAVMPLVIFFVPDPEKGVAEMARVVAPGGLVCAYAWDMPGGGFPYHALQAEVRALGFTVPKPPSTEASRIDSLQALWNGAGLRSVETREIAVERSFADFDDYWATVLGAPSIGATLRGMPPEEMATLQRRMRVVLDADASGRITCTARANAVRGRVAGAAAQGSHS